MIDASPILMNFGIWSKTKLFLLNREVIGVFCIMIFGASNVAAGILQAKIWISAARLMAYGIIKMSVSFRAVQLFCKRLLWQRH